MQSISVLSSDVQRTGGLAGEGCDFCYTSIPRIFAVQEYECMSLLRPKFVGRAPGIVPKRLINAGLAEPRCCFFGSLLVIQVDRALGQKAVNMKRGSMRDVGTLVKRTSEREERQISRYVSALDPVLLRLDVDSASKIVVQKECDEVSRSQVLRSLPFLSLLCKKVLKIFPAPGTGRQCFDMRLDCELCF